MIEVRPIRESEANEFLALLCDVFELDIDRARGVFFNEPLFDLRRKWALFERGKMVSILTTVPLNFGWGKAVGIAGVATALSRQGEGFAGHLLARVIQHSEANDEGTLLLFAKNMTIYERCGFRILDDVVRGPIQCRAEQSPSPVLNLAEIQDFYSGWAERDPSRLRRDTARWNFWKWNLRVCTAYESGYVCHEGQQMRECVLDQPPHEWKLPIGTEWFGLRSMADRLQLPLGGTSFELWLMGRNVPATPQMFMTDQF